MRHFLIEPTPNGVRIKGCNNEPIFGSLSALVYQHSITQLALPCRLIIPQAELTIGDRLDGLNNVNHQVANGTLGNLGIQGASCNVLYLYTMDTESLTGNQAIRITINELMSIKPPPVPIVVHFKVNSNGITLTDNNRKYVYNR